MEEKGRFLPFTFGAYLIFWIILAFKPVDRHDWVLENLLIFISTIVLAATYRRFRFSNLSYGLILIFLALHTIGAHYTYAKVPAGFWLTGLVPLWLATIMTASFTLASGCFSFTQCESCYSAPPERMRLGRRGWPWLRWSP